MLYKISMCFYKRIGGKKYCSDLIISDFFSGSIAKNAKKAKDAKESLMSDVIIAALLVEQQGCG